VVKATAVLEIRILLLPPLKTYVSDKNTNNIDNHKIKKISSPVKRFSTAFEEFISTIYNDTAHFKRF
jgi:hypothetical protein